MIKPRTIPIILLLLTAICALSACETLSRLDLVRKQELPKIKKEFKANNLHLGSPVFIRIFKEESELELWAKPPHQKQYRLFKTYPICKYSGRLGPKLFEGDHQAPEGFYAINAKWMNPESKYHLSMNVGYPNLYDQAHGRTGSFIMIHGDCVSEGCYAMTDPIIEELYLIVSESQRRGHLQTPVHIFPFRMTTENLERHKNYPWTDFWLNLKTGHDLFEQTKIPPNVTLDGLHYGFWSQNQFL